MIEEELTHTVKALAKGKSPSPYDLTADFFLKHIGAL